MLLQLINKKQIMQKNKSHLAQNKSLKGEFLNPFFFLEQRKPSLSFEQQQRYFFKNKIMASHEGPEPPNEKVLRHQICFLYPKDLHGSKKRAVLTPKKIEVRQKLYETLEECIMKKQLEAQQVKRSIYYQDARSPEKEGNTKAANEKASNRACIYQPFKKSTTNKDRLKPITISNKVGIESEFLNVQKIILMEGDRSKKNHIIAINQFEKERIPGRFGSHKLMREVSLGKEKFNGGRLLPLSESSTHLEQSQGLIDQTCSVKEYQSADTQNMKIQEENLGIEEELKIMKEIQLLRKKKPSPQKRNNRRKLNIPFETYYYRDMLWKVNYSNDLYIQAPIEYEHRLKVHVGKGNNSCMVSGLISRRPYFAITDRVQQANFVWTQIKMLQYYKTQQDHLQELPQNQENSNYQSSLLTSKDIKQYNAYIANYFNTEQHCDERLISRSKAFKYRKYIKSQQIKDIRMHNHLINNYVIGNKKALFNTMANYYKETNQEVFDFLPLTFHIKDGMEDKKYFQFLKYYHKRAKQIIRNNEDKTKEKQYNAWIVKPGQNSNRGNGIKMCLTLQDIKSVLKKRQVYKDGTSRTYIVQAYIQRPLLYFKRKFDLRHYIMITCINGIMKGYWYKYGYVRTTSSQYSLKANDGSIHLTNDAVQKNLPDYGKYEKGNKISYDELNAYIEKYHKKSKTNFYESIYPKMKRMATDAMRACLGGIDPSKKSNNFQVFGMDFMIDANLDVWLIEINSNPCLELSCPLLASLIPKMVENALQLTLDAMFPPPVRYSPKGIHYFKQLEKQNKFQLVYDERVERLCKGSLEVLDNKLLEEEDDTFEDCGDQWEDD